MAVYAVQTIRAMRGGSNAKLVLGADRRLWVVKFRNNPQGERILANEMLATRIAAALGLTVPETDVVEVTDWLAHTSSDLWLNGPQGTRVRCAPGFHFGSLYVGGLMPGQVVDYLPDEMLPSISNLREFAGIFCFDKWTGNCDGRQAVFSRTAREKRYHATFIDQGFCFHANEWTFSDSPLRGRYPRKCVYERVTGWDSFEPWLSQLEAIELDTLMRIADNIPAEWYGGHPEPLEQLINTLFRRRGEVRDLISDVRNANPDFFPNWKQVKQAVVSNFPEENIVPPVLGNNCLA